MSGVLAVCAGMNIGFSLGENENQEISFTLVELKMSLRFRI